MNEKVYDALEVCLQALETGAEPNSVVMLFPEMKEDLLPLLETSRQAQMLALPEVPGTVLLRGRARVLKHAARMREMAVKSQKQRLKITFPRLAVSLAFTLLFLFSGTGLVRASDGALPGDNLYPVKRTWEDVRLLLVFSPESREELENEFEQERLHEIDELLAEGRHETIMFAGVVTEQQGNLWVVSGVPVQITTDSRLPAVPVTVGTSVMLQGRTNARGFVEAEYIQVLASNIVLPTSVPTQIEMREDDFNRSNTGLEENDNERQNEAESDSSSDGDHNNRGSEDNSNGNSGKNENDYDEDRSNDNDRNKEQNDEEKRDYSGLDGGDDETKNENENEDNH